MSDDETDVDLHAIPCPRELPVEILAELAKVRAEFAVPIATPVMSDGSEGPPLELRGLFEQFFLETAK